MPQSSGNSNQQCLPTSDALNAIASLATDNAADANADTGGLMKDTDNVGRTYDILKSMDAFDARVDEMAASSQAAAGSVDPAQVEEIAHSNRQILEAVANHGDAITELASILGAMKESLSKVSVTQAETPTIHATEELEPAPVDPVEQWEQNRNAALQAQQQPAAPETYAPPAAAVVQVASEGDAVIGAVSEKLFDLVSQEAIAEMDEAQLRVLIIDRESIISQLARRVQQKSKADLQLTPDQLRECTPNLPAELAARVDATLQALDEQIRMGELDFSLERARMSRQKSQLELTRKIIEANARAIGFDVGPDGKITGRSNDEAATAPKGRSWLGALGLAD